MKTHLLSLAAVLLCGLLSSSTYAGEYQGIKADQKLPGASFVKDLEYTDAPYFARFRKGHEVALPLFATYLKRQFKAPEGTTFQVVSIDKDPLNHLHYRYQQLYQGIPLEGVIYIAHTFQGKVYSMNGMFYSSLNLPSTPVLTEEQALSMALDHVGAETYRWELAHDEAHLKHEQHDHDATYYPEGHLVYMPQDANWHPEQLKLTYRFNIYAAEPLSRAEIYVNALTGEIVYSWEKIHHADALGSCVTAYSGTQPMTADSFGGGFRMRESGRGNGVETYDLNNATGYGGAVDFTDADNFWDNINAQLDEYAGDAHWGAEMTYDYFFNQHGRNSIDGNGFTLLSYVHYGNNFANAFWDGQRMTYGDGNGGSMGPLTALDIAGHEVSHGLTNFTANLVYQNESGALNESFSDIFGTAIEFYAKPATANWTVGEDIGLIIRSMSNPGAYNDPDTYGAGDWYTGTADNGGVHINSGVQNYWFYLLSVGGSGTNDAGDVYNINAIGIDDASSIAFRNLTVYLGVNSQYTDARFFAIQSAIDLFGPCSPEVIECTNAWYAVNVGDEWDPTVTADFSADITQNCDAPFTVNFDNLSSMGGSYTWDFGDGNTSTQISPSHTYTAAGTYDVQLILDAGSCGSDTVLKTSFVVLDSNYPCISIMPPSGAGTTQTSCTGTMYDNGGPNANYSDQTDVNVTIAPTGASSVTINFNSFNLEAGYDYMYIYDGPNTTSPLIGQYDGTALPNGGSITSTAPSITIRMTSDQAVNESGFELDWTCFINNSAPIADFRVNAQTSCSGTIDFIDESLFVPTSWLWDFGDGNTSTQQNPTHTYASDGLYTVTLTVTNSFGTDQVVRVDYINISSPAGPTVVDDALCSAGVANLYALGTTGQLDWYDAATGGTNVHTGPNYSPTVTNTTSYWVEEVFGATSVGLGPVDNSFGGGGNFNGNQHLIFDVFTDIILESVEVYANGAGNRTIELRDNTGNVLQTLTTNIADGNQTVALNWDIPAGTNYQLGTANGSNPGLFRNNNGPSYPYTVNGMASITSSSAGAQYYYFFYNWQIREPLCTSERTEVVATVIQAPSGADDDRCGPGVVNLSATGSGNGTLNWYDAANGGSLVNTGATYNPNIPATTNYYVEEVITPAAQYVGPTDNSIGGGGYFNGSQYLIFDAYDNSTLVSVWVDANSAGNRTIELQDNTGAVLETTTVNIPAGQSRVTLNFPLPIATDLRLYANTPDLFRNNGGVNYPYDLAGLVSITGSSAGAQAYYHFYDWEIQEADCITDRVQVTGTVNANADATITTTTTDYCLAQTSVTLTALNGGGTWSGSGIMNASMGTWDASSAGLGTHTITYSLGGQCPDVQTIDLTVTNVADATITAAGPFCSSDASTSLVAADAGGTWSGSGITDANAGVFDPATAGVGSHTITYSIPGVCGATATETIVVTNALDATITPSAVTICEADAPFALSAVDPGGNWSGPGIVDANAGTFDPSNAGAGTHTITYTIGGACGDTDTETFVVVPNDDATITTTVTSYCIAEASFNLTALQAGGVWSGAGITDANAGTFDPNTAGLGTHTITYTIAGACGDAQTIDLTITNVLDASILPAGPYCSDDAAVNLTGADAGGTWSGDGITDANAGTFDPSVAGIGTHTINYSIPGTCGDTQTTSIVVEESADASIVPLPDPICELGGPVNLTAVNPGGYWSGPGIADSVLGTFDPAITSLGAWTVTYTIYGDCGDSQTTVVTVDMCDGVAEDAGFINVNLSPNPNNGNFILTIEAPSSLEGSNWYIINSIGELVKQGTIPTGSSYRESITMEEDARGVYFLQIQSTQGVTTHRFIVQ